VLKGLDKLFTSSNSLTREQVSKAAQMAEGRVSKTVQRVKEMVDRQKNTVYEQGKPVVASQWAALDQALGKEHEDLAAKVGSRSDGADARWLGWTM
jgi:predicted transcriptional regulator